MLYAVPGIAERVSFWAANKAVAMRIVHSASLSLSGVPPGGGVSEAATANGFVASVELLFHLLI
jgi:hypothetical protein